MESALRQLKRALKCTVFFSQGGGFVVLKPKSRNTFIILNTEHFLSLHACENNVIHDPGLCLACLYTTCCRSKLIASYMILKWPVIPFSDQTPTPTRFLKNCEEVGLFSELDCSIEQEFCKAQEEEDSKQVQTKKKAGKPPPPPRGQVVLLLSGAIISHVIIKASTCTWTFDRLRCLIFTLLTLIDPGVFVVTTRSCFSSKVESENAPSACVVGRKCSSSALSAVKDGPSSCRSVPPPHVSGKEIVFYTCNFKQPLISPDRSPISFQDATFLVEIKGLSTKSPAWAEKSLHW